MLSLIRPSHHVVNRARHYSTKTVPLSFTKFDTYKTHKKPAGVEEKKEPLVICHGLFGSKQNWKSLAKSLSIKSQCEVYTIDARNHGESPHVEEHTYDTIAQDVYQFIQDQGLNKPMLMGHSMGAKAMMTLALRRPEIASKLIVIDMAPIPIKLSGEYQHHVEAMREINRLQLKKQKEADKVLQQYEPDLVVRQFLMTNLKKNLNKDGVYEFRIPYDTLGRSIDQLGDFFQSQPPLETYQGSTLFITGGLSPYRREFLEYPDLIKAQFPNSRIVNIEGAGHWVQAEKPEEFISISTEFINKSN